MADWIVSFSIILFIFQLILTLACLCTWFERKISALLQDRIGANRSGTNFKFEHWYYKPFAQLLNCAGRLGFVNTFFCDPIKALFKEDFVPNSGDKLIHTIAPIFAVLPVFMAFAVLPVAPQFSLPFYDKPILIQAARLDIGILLVIAMGGFSTLGLLLAGWASNNKFSLLGSVRAASQLFSYELVLGVALLTMISVYGTLDAYEMVEAQGNNIFHWGFFRSPITCLLLFIAGMVETKRAPFDLPEAESELVSGYLTEYSGMKFFSFWIGEFAEIGLVSLLVTLLFFSGWNLPFGFNLASWQVACIGYGVLFLKVAFFCALQIIIRWTLPRFRYDQLLNLGWKILLPVAVINLLVTVL